MATAEELNVIVEAKVNKAIKDLKKFDKQTNKSEKSTKDFAKSMLKRAAAGAVAVASVGKLISAGKEAVSLYGEQVQAEQKLAAAIRTTGGNVDELLPRYKALASSIQNVTTVGDESTLALIQQAKSMGVADDQIEEATKGAIGLSKALGIGTQQAIRGVSNALNGEFTTLQRYIPALRTTEDESEKLAIVQKAMADGFETAKAEADSSYGSMQQYSNAAGDLKEQLGQTIAEGMEPFIGQLTDYVTRTANAIQNTRDLKDTLDALSAGKEVAGGVEDLNKQLELAKQRQKELNAARSFIGAQGREELDQLNKLIPALEEEKQAKAELARQSARGQAAAKDAAAKDAAAAERRRKNLELLQGEYEKTDRYQKRALESLIAKFEGFEVQGPKTLAILERLRGELEKFNEEAEEQTLGDAMDAYSKRNEIAQTWHEKEMERIRLLKIADKDAEREKTEALKEEVEKRKATMQDFASVTTGLMGSISTITSNMYQARIDAAEEGSEEEKQLMREQAQAQKNWATMQALVNTAVAVTKTMTTVAYPANVPLAALQAAAGAVQVAAIQSQPLPSFASGGDFVTTGPTAMVVGESGRERVRIDPQNDTRNINEGVTVVINGDSYGPGGAEEFADYIVKAINRGRRSGRVEALN